MELDPLALNGDINGFGAPDWYNYALGNPLTYTDPNGENPVVGAAAGTAVCGPPCTVIGFLAGLGAAAVLGKIGSDIIDSCAMAKGGKQNIDNEYVRQARQLPRNVDPCEWLRLQYINAPDSATRMKIKLAQKALGCRHSSGGG